MLNNLKEKCRQIVCIMNEKMFDDPQVESHWQSVNLWTAVNSFTDTVHINSRPWSKVYLSRKISQSRKSLLKKKYLFTALFITFMLWFANRDPQQSNFVDFSSAQCHSVTAVTLNCDKYKITNATHTTHATHTTKKQQSLDDRAHQRPMQPCLQTNLQKIFRRTRWFEEKVVIKSLSMFQQYL